jgi:hypothetical protein
MQIRQLQVANDKIQDRLVLRIATQENEEIRVFFTRRFLSELWPFLVAMLLEHLSIQAAENDDLADEINAGEVASFEKPFVSDNPYFPLGSMPLLASEAALEATAPGMARLLLREGRERSFNMNLNAELMQALCTMLREGSEQSGWELELGYGETISTTSTSSSCGKGLLH